MRIDNSAGVDTSDHEVNIKILLNEAVQAGDLTMKQRDKLLAQMTDEVAQLVLRDNYLQTQALSIAEAQSFTLLDQQNRFMKALERAGRLDRAIEFLPDDEAVRQRAQAAHRPDPAGAGGAARLCQDLALRRAAAVRPAGRSAARGRPGQVFPGALQKSYQEQIGKHRLRREIIATVVTNTIINRMGGTFVHIMKERTGQTAAAIARAYAITRGAFACASCGAASRRSTTRCRPICRSRCSSTSTAWPNRRRSGSCATGSIRSTSPPTSPPPAPAWSRSRTR